MSGIVISRLRGPRTLSQFAAVSGGVAFLLLSPAAYSAWQGGVDLSGQNYALESKPTGRVDFSTQLQSESKVDGERFAARELRLLGFFETGNSGDRSLDLDPVAIRAQLTSEWEHHLWLGRVHPLTEQDPAAEIRHTSAVGANWVQNQSDPLSPRVSGWLGVGIRSQLPGMPVNVTAAYSPLFLPSFGPRVEYSEFADTTGSRFGRRPPSTVRLNDNAEVPLRYRIDTGDIRNIVFQQQGLLSLDHTNGAGKFALLAWTAPAPDPSVDIAGKLRVTSSETDVLAVAKPVFPRLNFTGFIYRNRDVFGQPEIQVIREWTGLNTALSVEGRPLSFLRAGVLHTFSSTFNRLPDAGTPAVDSPKYARQLVWARAEHRFERQRVTPWLTWEQHLENARKDALFEPGILYEPGREFGVFAAATVLVGEDRSYFGAWRGLDSARVGLRSRW